ncbi:hypothetical protein ACQPU1_05995 [Clostridium paraputrificum]|uniref:hypothetical protein n=1 Tax=Clostridium paraputrificum TaxID=29363 RepID=UPI003D341A89
MKKVIMYFKSFITQLSLFIGVLMYICYAYMESNWGNSYLIAVCLFVGFAMPHYTKFSNYAEQKMAKITGKIFMGKIGRFVPQAIFNITVVYILTYAEVIHVENLNVVGGRVIAALLTTFASQGMQYVASELSNREKGNIYFNTALALCLSIVISALAALGIKWVQVLFVVCGIIFGTIGVLYGLYTDIKVSIAPKGGVGIFCGTFNPIHKSHIAILKKFIEDRELEKVYLHSTVVPKLHAKFLRDGIIRIKKMEDGMRVYERTEKADVNINYFITGNKFYEAKNRYIMLKESIREVGLEDKVEVLFLPDIYEKDGFYGVIDNIKKRNKGKKIHAMHGSDGGGMMVRGIYDASFGMWPYPVIRRDNVSATKIREGAKGMTLKSVDILMDKLKDSCKDNTMFNLNGNEYEVVNGIIYELDKSSEKVSI